MSRRSSAAVFLANMQGETSPASTMSPASSGRARKNGHPAPVGAGGRASRRHVGGYLERETVEQFAALRARLGLDNSQLLTLAIREFYAKQQARRAFGDE